MNTEIKLNARLATMILSAISIISFFLPLASFSAMNGSRRVTIMRYTGYRLLMGFTDTIIVNGNTSIPLDEPGTQLALVLILFPFIVFLVSFIKGLKQKTYGLIITICSIINFPIWLLIKSAFNEMAGDLGSDVEVSFGTGFTLMFVASAFLIVLGIMVCKSKISMDQTLTDISSLSAGAEKLSSVDVSKVKVAANKIDFSKIKDAANKIDFSKVKNVVGSFEFSGGSWTCVCGNEVEGGKFCPKCGTPKPSVPKCPKCGAKIKPNDAFCMSCGTRIDIIEADTIESWICVCGNEVKGEEFCSICGTPKLSALKCPKCGAKIQPNDVFCVSCGTKIDLIESDTIEKLQSEIVTELYCPSCGAEVKEGYKFCLKCGAVLEASGRTGCSS